MGFAGGLNGNSFRFHRLLVDAPSSGKFGTVTAQATGAVLSFVHKIYMFTNNEHDNLLNARVELDHLLPPSSRVVRPD